MSNSTTKIPILVDIPKSQTRGGGSGKVWEDIDINTLKSETEKIGLAIQTMFSNFNSATEAYQLDNIEVNVGIKAGGKLGFLGSGVSGEGEAGIKLVFNKKDIGA